MAGSSSQPGSERILASAFNSWRSSQRPAQEGHTSTSTLPTFWAFRGDRQPGHRSNGLVALAAAVPEELVVATSAPVSPQHSQLVQQQSAVGSLGLQHPLWPPPPQHPL